MGAHDAGASKRGRGTCTPRTDRSGSTPQGSNGTCLARRLAHRQWAGGGPARPGPRCLCPAEGHRPAAAVTLGSTSWSEVPSGVTWSLRECAIADWPPSPLVISLLVTRDIPAAIVSRLAFNSLAISPMVPCSCCSTYSKMRRLTCPCADAPWRGRWRERGRVTTPEATRLRLRRRCVHDTLSRHCRIPPDPHGGGAAREEEGRRPDASIGGAGPRGSRSWPQAPRLGAIRASVAFGPLRLKSCPQTSSTPIVSLSGGSAAPRDDRLQSRFVPAAGTGKASHRGCTGVRPP